MAGLLHLVIYVLIAGVLVALVFYVVDAIPIPAPVGKIIKVVCVVIACLLIVYALAGLGGVSLPKLE